MSNDPLTPTGPGAGREDGFTIVEMMVAMLIMLIGVLGTLTIIQGSIASTSRTNAREQGTNLARDLVERARQASYTDVTMAQAPREAARDAARRPRSPRRSPARRPRSP